ncbi:MAG: winged helix-turn-helix transcriptional regulator [Gaiellaceae bacterium]
MAEVHAFLDTEGCTQNELAERAGVSQSTVSRALERTPARNTRAHRKLMHFIREHAAPPVTVASAVSKVWDGTPEHDAALAALISASSALWPKMGSGR